jgi:hypothetical protein
MPPLRSLAVTPLYTRHHYWYTYADRPLRSSTRSNASLGPMDCRQPRFMSHGRCRYEDDRSIRLRRDQARRWAMAASLWKKARCVGQVDNSSLVEACFAIVKHGTHVQRTHGSEGEQMRELS